MHVRRNAEALDQGAQAGARRSFAGQDERPVRALPDAGGEGAREDLEPAFVGDAADVEQNAAADVVTCDEPARKAGTVEREVDARR